MCDEGDLELGILKLLDAYQHTTGKLVKKIKLTYVSELDLDGHPVRLLDNVEVIVNQTATEQYRRFQ